MPEPINTILSTPDQTIGLCETFNNTEDFIGEFHSSKLKTWIDWVLQNYGDTVVYLYSHHNANPESTARLLSASVEHGDRMQVVVCGVDCDDVVELREGKKE